MKQATILTRLIHHKVSACELKSTPVKMRNQILIEAAKLISKYEKKILAANEKDLLELDTESQKKGALNSAFRDRLLLTPARIQNIVKGIHQIVSLPDPLAEIIEQRQLANGLKIKKIRSPIGIIFMIFESRPNVAIEAFCLALKSGNVILLKGGREARKTTQILYQILETACLNGGGSKHMLWGIEDPKRKITQFLLQQSKLIDLVIPRGGHQLIQSVSETSRIPVIKNDRGLCHIYVHQDAHLDTAAKIILNAKTQRPGVCNAMETLLVHEKISKQFLPKVHSLLSSHQVEWRSCPNSFKILKKLGNVKKAKKLDWDREYLDLTLNCRIVNSIEKAIHHIDLHGSRHSEAIISKSRSAAQHFQSKVDAAVVYWNASTRFTDGLELGLGGELGISTQKLHVRGPVGLRELTCIRWIINGQGQVRI